MRNLIIILGLVLCGCGAAPTTPTGTSANAAIDSTTPTAGLTCPTDMVLLPDTKGRGPICIDPVPETVESDVPYKTGNWTQAKQGCKNLGRVLCSTAQMIHSCDDKYMPGGYFWTTETDAQPAPTTAIYSCEIVQEAWKILGTHPYLCCTAPN